MAKNNYPAKYSRITITTKDGELREYDITAGAGILPYLMREAADTGSMVILNGPEAFAIPTDNILEVKIQEFNSPEERVESCGDGK